MTAQDLKNSILQLAVQGKLVPQDSSDEPASELLKRIRTEKDRLVKDGKIKKEKAIAPILEDEIPFDIPESWEWVHIQDIILFCFTGKNPDYSDIPNQNYCIGQRNNQEYGINLNGIKFVSPDFWSSRTEDSFLKDGDLLLNTLGTGTMGRSGIWHCEVEKTISDSCVLVLRTVEGVLSKYILYFLRLNRRTLEILASGTTNQKSINRNDILSFIIPLPPLAEQERIVSKLEGLLPYIEEYDKVEKQLSALNAEFPDKLRKSILQQAVMGKLTERDPADEPAFELLKRIRVEKKSLIEEEKARNDKPYQLITEDEYPFDIPEKWGVIRIGEIGLFKKGPFGSSLTKNMFVPKSSDAVKVYEQKNAIQKDWTLGEYYIRRSYFEEKMRGFEVHSGDVIVSCAGTIGETYVLPDGIEQGIINQALMRMKIVPSIDLDYFLLYFDYVLKKSAQGSSKGSAIKNIPPFDIFKNMVLPLPPLAEQKRIVARVEELLKICDELK